MVKKLLLYSFLLGLGTLTATSQNLHSQANAASIENEADATTGWTGLGVVTSDNTEAQTGNFAIRVESTANNGRTLEYTFNATVGVDYTISIWAKQGPMVSTTGNPAFANWVGMQGFATTTILGTDWVEYVFNVTATGTNPIIRLYTSPFSQRFVAGNTVIVDSVSITADGSDTEAPTAVTDLSSSNTTESTTDLSWSASTDNVGVTNYEIFQDGISIGNSGVNTNFIVLGLTPNTSYDFTVVAEDAAGNTSTVSNTETVNTLADAQAPSAIVDLSSANTTDTTTDLSWSASTDNVGVTNYEVFQDGISIANTGVTTNFNVTGLTAETSYDFTVFAEDAAGNTSLVSNTETVVTTAAPDTEAPSAITDLASANTTATTTDLSWSASTDNVGVTNYEVFQDGISVANTGTTTAFNVTGLSPSTSYDFTVFAEDAAGNTSNVSNTETVNTPFVPDNEAPTAVTDLTSSNTTSTTTSLSWTASTDNIGVTNYEIFQDAVSIGNSGVNTTFNVTGLTPSTSYDFTVFAEDAAGNTSPVSNTETVLTNSGGGVVDYTSENSNMTTVDWTARDLFADRNVGIGTTDTQGYRLAVAGNVIAEGVKVELQGNWPDFVFLKDYDLMQLDQVREFIKENGHLPNIPSAKVVAEEGIDLGTMDAKLLRKIEELTLYLLKQEEEIQRLKKENEDIKGILSRLEKVEKQLDNKTGN
ncbi:fibronectin type III domain-containing protein [Flagellimonas sp. 2504JD4-2]